MKKKIFADVESIGDLYFESIFFEFETEPVSFTCKDVKNNLYFGHCYKKAAEHKWFIVPINEKKLTKLKEQRSSIRKTLLSSSKIYNVTLDVNGNVNMTNSIKIEDLPSENIYLRIH